MFPSDFRKGCRRFGKGQPYFEMGTPDELEAGWADSGPWALKRDERTGCVLEEARTGFVEALRLNKERWSDENKTCGWAAILGSYAVFVKERNLHDGVTYNNGSVRWLGPERGLLKVKRASAVQYLKTAVTEWGWSCSKVR